MYMTSLLECSPYPLCFFTFDGHLITCNPAAVAVFGALPPSPPPPPGIPPPPALHSLITCNPAAVAVFGARSRPPPPPAPDSV